MVTSEKRQFERKSCYLEAHYESPTLSLNVVIRNISLGGCFINTPYLDTIGTSAMIFIQPPSERSPIALPAKVVYTKDEAIDNSGMGIKFQFYRTEDITKVKQLIDQIVSTTRSFKKTDKSKFNYKIPDIVLLFKHRR